MSVRIHDRRACLLGEGALWHPERGQLLWFDILSKQLRTSANMWQFDQHVSAAGWIDHDTLLIASETALLRMNLTTGATAGVIDLEADDPRTRSNDGRADPMGGFWIGTMGKALEPGLGAIYRYYRGEVRKIIAPLTIPNAICFAPDGRVAYYTDTPERRVLFQPLDAEGWPDGEPGVLVDLRREQLNPDGAIVDREGCLWIAQWGASRVARYSSEGVFLSAVDLPASQITCPALNDQTLYVTSAAEGVEEMYGGMTFAIDVAASGQKEHRVLL